VGEVLLDGVVGGGAPGSSTLRVWEARLEGGEPVAHEHAELRWVETAALADLDWIPADRPLLPAVRALLAGV
jgi:8-oxo-dGTP diphosphatase